MWHTASSAQPPDTPHPINLISIHIWKLVTVTPEVGIGHLSLPGSEFLCLKSSSDRSQDQWCSSGELHWAPVSVAIPHFSSKLCNEMNLSGSVQTLMPLPPATSHQSYSSHLAPAPALPDIWHWTNNLQNLPTLHKIYLKYFLWTCLHYISRLQGGRWLML